MPTASVETRFFDETALTVRNSQRRCQDVLQHRPANIDIARLRDLPCHVEDRALAFFVHNYVFEVDSVVGNYEYLPLLLLRCSSRGLLATVATAAGLAALANSGNSPGWKSQAYYIYGKAIQKLQNELKNSTIENSDEVLGSILLLGAFEVRRPCCDIIPSARNNTDKHLDYHIWKPELNNYTQPAYFRCS